MPTPPNQPISGEAFRHFLTEGTRYVERHADEINALNVFPVPDGDTGTNMLLTLKSAISSPDLPPAGTGTIAEVSHGLARGALLGARGNSGVILSQFMKGIATSLANLDVATGADIAAALVSAAAAGYQAVGKPVEGTMLTVMHQAAAGITDVDAPVSDVLRQALDAATDALAHTPEQLPILAEAGVVDAGGQGIVALLAGALASVTGEPVALEITAPLGGAPTIDVSQQFLEHTEDEMYGFCTQFVVFGADLDVDAVREQIVAMASSTVVVGDDRTVRIHAHAEDPGPLLTLGVSLGSVDQVSIQNMDNQHQEFMALHGYTQAERQAMAVVAVAPGEGLARVFRDLGAAQVVGGGQTMNPSAADLLDAVKRANADHTILLPNNPNIIMAANQAAELANAERETNSVSVVSSRNVPQGVAAMLAFNPDFDAAGNADAMTSALAEVSSGEITTAVRSTTLDGVAVEEGQVIALLDGKIIAATSAPHDALMALLDHAAPDDGALITLYHGADTSDDDAQQAAQDIQARFAGVEVDIQSGEQPHYQYLVSIE
jgi:DAK2 domain fusion protein YloV